MGVETIEQDEMAVKKRREGNIKSQKRKFQAQIEATGVCESDKLKPSCVVLEIYLTVRG